MLHINSLVPSFESVIFNLNQPFQKCALVFDTARTRTYYPCLSMGMAFFTSLERSALLRLPTELRHAILSYLPRLRERPVTVRDDRIYRCVYAIPLDVLRTCHLLYTDAEDILHRLNQKRPHTITCTVHVYLKSVDQNPYTLAKLLINALHTGPSALFCRNEAYHSLRNYIFEILFEKRKYYVMSETGQRNLDAFVRKHVQHWVSGQRPEIHLRRWNHRYGLMASWRLAVVGHELKIVRMIPPKWYSAEEVPGRVPKELRDVTDDVDRCWSSDHAGLCQCQHRP
jgi:hypothetical protein